MEYVKIEQVNSAVYNVYWVNDHLIGQFLLDVDGLYYFNFNGTGNWPDYSLIEIGKTLEKLNRPYQELIEEYFKQQIEKDDETEI